MTVGGGSVCYHDVGECVVPSRTTTTTTVAGTEEDDDAISHYTDTNTNHVGIDTDGRGGGMEAEHTAVDKQGGGY